MKLNYSEALLLWATISQNGKMVPSPQGEMPDLRTLNGEESSQRGHFKKAFQPVEEAMQEKREEARKVLKEKIDAARIACKSLYPKKDQTDEDYEAYINSLINTDEENKEALKVFNDQVKELNECEEEYDLTEKTLKVLKKYFVEFGDTVGFKIGDDEAVMSLTEKLKDIKV
jgi:hypothetical protein